MFNLDTVASKNDNKNWRYRMLMIGPSGSGKTNALLNLIQQDINIIDKIYLYAKDLDEPKYQFLIEKREDAGIKNSNNLNAFIEYSNAMDMFTITLMTITQKEKEKFWLYLTI